MGLNPKLWNGKRVLVTGHTGFKGSWLTLILKELGAEVVGLALPPEGSQSLYLDAGIGHEADGVKLEGECGLERVLAGEMTVFVNKSNDWTGHEPEPDSRWEGQKNGQPHGTAEGGAEAGGVGVGGDS